ncbi:hypothetical protein BDE02_05G009600 [Populus trichocarpa]|nr:hypothetical protein BDE02_05G009600 [Populus trichocarpa]
MMKSTVVIFVPGLTFLHLQVDAKRLVLKETNAEKTDNQHLSNPNNQQGKASTYGYPVTGSVPAVETKNDNATSSPSTSNNNGSPDDETNSSYGNYGDPSGSSTETHHAFTNDCQPKKGC